MATPTRTHGLGLRVARLEAVVATVVILIAMVSPLHAQERIVVPHPGEPAAPGSDVPRRATGAFVGVLGGAITGFILTYHATRSYQAFYGAVIGAGALAPLGAHFFDDDPGSLLPPLLATAAFTAFMLTRDEWGTEFLVVLPIGQILASTLFGRGPG